MTPLVIKSLAAQLNISKDNGPSFYIGCFQILVMNPIEDKHLWWLKVFQYPFGVMEPTQVIELVHPVEFGIAEK